MLDAGQATAIVYPVPIGSYCRQALLKYFQLIHYRSIIYTWYFDVLELSKNCGVTCLEHSMVTIRYFCCCKLTICCSTRLTV